VALEIKVYTSSWIKASYAIVVFNNGKQGRSVYTPALLATIVLYRIGTPATHGNSPGMRRRQSNVGEVMRNDRSTFSRVQDQSYRPPRFRTRKGRPASCGFRIGIVCYAHQQTGQGLADFVFRGAQLYKTMLLQVMPLYS